jgi:maleylacetoacetate isomerase
MQLFTFWRSLASFRVRVALNLKGVAYDAVAVDLTKSEQRADPFRAVNPQMVIPALVDGDGPVLFQSLAILEYLEETHPEPPLLPRDSRARAFVRALAQIVACDCHPMITPRMRKYLEDELKVDEPARLAWNRHWITEGLAAIETHLARHGTSGRYCHGDAPTIADICLVSHAVGAGYFDCPLAPYPLIEGIVARCLAQEAFAAAHPLRQPGAPAGAH